VQHRLATTTLVLLATLLAAGCGAAAAPPPVASPSSSSSAGVDLRTPAAPAGPAKTTGDASDGLFLEAARLATPLNNFGLALLAQEAKSHSEGNVVISPVSLQAVLAMTLNGARGETAAQMQKVLSLDALGLRQADQSWADLIAFTQRKTDAEIRVADSLWLRHGVAFEPSFLAANRDYFAADAQVMPDDLHDATAQINDWVDQHTGGRIKHLVEGLDPDTALVLVNAIYVKAGWEYFKIANTRPEPFTSAGGGQLQVPMMHGRVNAEVTQTAAYLALPLAANGRVTVTIVLPNAGHSPESILPLLAHGDIDALNDNMRSRPYIVDLALPRFRAEFRDDDLKTALESLGMTRAFTSRAQFRGIAPGRLWISQVIHQATLDVNEQGVEAAAGTAVVMTSGGPPTKRLTVRVDRPFVVVLSEGESQAPLFVAIVRDPSR
jgi:serine protease inhibitor